MNLTTMFTASIISVAFLITAALLRAFSPGNNSQIKRVAYFCLMYLLTVVYLQFADFYSWVEVAEIVGNLAFLTGWITIVELSLIILFKLALPKLGQHPPSIIGDLFLGLSIIILIGLTLRNFGVDTASIVTTSAVVTGILAIGLQATLGNIIGGVALQLDRSIKIGDWIQLENGNQGKVQEIRWRHTVIQTRDWDTIIVPNSSLLSANITILGKRVGEPIQHRMWVYFNVDFRTSPSYVIETVEKALQAPPEILNVAKTPSPNCICLDFSSDNRDSYAHYAVRYWLTEINDDDPTSSLIRRRLYAALQRANIPLAIPASQLFIDNDNSDRRKRKNQKDIEKRVEALKAVGFLSVLTEEEYMQLAKSLQPVLYSQGENIMIQNDQADWLYILTDGRAEVWVDSAKKQSKVADITAPTFIGEMGLMTGAPRSATIVASTDVYCYRLHRNDFQGVISKRPNIIEQISTVLAKREVETQTIKEQLNKEAKNQKIEEASVHLFTKISTFFGLD